MLLSLTERHLVKVKGRQRGQRGNPYLYGTTDHFLEVFGLERIEDLPPLEPPADFTPLQAPREQQIGPEGEKEYPLFEGEMEEGGEEQVADEEERDDASEVEGDDEATGTG